MIVRSRSTESIRDVNDIYPRTGETRNSNRKEGSFRVNPKGMNSRSDRVQRISSIPTRAIFHFVFVQWNDRISVSRNELKGVTELVFRIKSSTAEIHRIRRIASKRTSLDITLVHLNPEYA